MAVTLNGNGTVTGIVNLPRTSMATGSVLQVIHTIKKDLFSTTVYASQGYTAITGLSATITPTSSTSKILVSAHVLGACSTGRWAGIRLYKAGSCITDACSSVATWGSAPTADGVKTNNNFLTIGYNPNDTHEENDPYVCSAEYLDTAGGTSAITYDLRVTGRESNTTTCINKGVITESSDATVAGVSTITLTEVAS